MLYLRLFFKQGGQFMKSEGTEIKIKSLQKALQVLECFVEIGRAHV